MKDTHETSSINPDAQTRKGPEDRNSNKGPNINLFINGNGGEEVVQVQFQKKKKKVRIETPEDDSEDEVDKPETTPARKLPELPYVSVPPITYKPRKTVTSEEQPATSKDKKPAYKVVAPLADPEQAEAIIKKFMDTPMSVTAGEVMGLSKQMRDLLRKLLTNKRKPYNDAEKILTALIAIEDTECAAETVDIAPTIEEYGEGEAIDLNTLPAATFTIQRVSSPSIPKGSLIVGDPVLQYYNDLAPGERPKIIYVAKDSTSLRTVYPLINKSAEEESLLDGGSQILSMSKATANKLGISWDPDIVIHMESANKGVEPTLGLARNVPFQFDDIMLFFQVHIIANPAYSVLLGRPFDTLTESVITNSRDGGQIITITDPNTRKRKTIPTYVRGRPRPVEPSGDANFQSSMI